MDVPLVKVSLQNGTAVCLEKLSDHLQGLLDMTVNFVRFQLDEPGRKVGQQGFEPYFFQEFQAFPFAFQGQGKDVSQRLES
jgi:hypothetical protein